MLSEFEVDIKTILELLIKNIYAVYGDQVFQ